MKKILCIFLLLALLLPGAALGETVVASFYPIYLFARNLTAGIDGLEVHCMAEPGTGCLHDYQLSTADMKALAGADAFLINGAGMESFLSFVMEALPDLPVVDASTGVALLEDDDGDEEYNSHIWLCGENAMQMVRNLAEGLMALYPQHSEAIAANRDDYLSRLAAVDEELKAGLAPLAGTELITFHEAFPYFAQAYGLEVAAVVTHDSDDSLSAWQLTRLIRLIQGMTSPVLFVEPQSDDIVAQTLAQETGAPIYTLDPCVTGPEGDDLPLTLYEDTMRSNMTVLLEAFQ